MKINAISVQGYQRITNVVVNPSAPILLIAGHNEAGKSSLADAIRHAFTNEAGRVKLKKNYRDLVNDGAKKSLVNIEFERGGEIGGASVTLPAGTHHTDLTVTEVHQCLLDARRFASMPDSDRRSLIYGLAGIRMNGKAISAKLIEAGANSEKVKAIEPILLSGFTAAEKEAAARVSECRGAWKAVTGEAYGKDKAVDWVAPHIEFNPVDLELVRANHESLAEQVNQSYEGLGAMKAKVKAFDDWATRRETMLEGANKLERAQRKLETDIAQLAECESALTECQQKATGEKQVATIECPCCQADLEFSKGKLIKHVPPTQVADPEAVARLPELTQARDKVVNWVANDKRDVEAAKTAAAVVAEMDANKPEDVDQIALAKAQAELKNLDHALGEVQASLRKLQDDEKASKSTTEVTAAAAKHHNDLTEWSFIASMLAPEGIQAELLSKAMGPLREELSGVATGTGFDAVTIDDDMTIRVGGRPYSLGSVSARWRADFALTYAIAMLSNERFMMVDEVDVLDPINRVKFLTFMHNMSGELDTAILLGTFKEPPQCPSTFDVQWISEGTNVREVVEA